MSADVVVDETTDHGRDPDASDGSSEPLVTTTVEEKQEEEEENNVFRVLAAQARTRSIAQLWVVVLGGAVDAGLFWWRHPMLTWLGAGCAAVAAYGAWGLLDRAIETRSIEPNAPRETLTFEGLRDLAAIAGTAAALWAVLSFMAVALGNWNH